MMNPTGLGRIACGLASRRVLQDRLRRILRVTAVTFIAGHGLDRAARAEARRELGWQDPQGGQKLIHPGGTPCGRFVLCRKRDRIAQVIAVAVRDQDHVHLPSLSMILPFLMQD